MILGAFLVVASIGSAVGDVQAGSCGNSSFAAGQCNAGGAYNKVKVADESACCAACSDDAQHCQSWVFRAGTKGGLNCHLHPDPLGATQSGPCTSGPTGPAPPPAPPTPPAPPAPPLPKTARNLLYIVVDDLRTEIMYTDRRKGLVTPAIDALAAKSMVFTRAYVQQGVCSPSRNSFLSGRRPDTTKTWNFKDSFRGTLGTSVSSWPGAFKNAGYTTAGLGKVYHPGHPAKDDGALSWSLDKFPYFHPKGFAKKISNASDSTFQDGMTTDVALQRLQALAKGTDGKPFFLAVGLHKPHVPWVMPQRFLDMQTPEQQMDTAANDHAPKDYCNVSFYRCPNAVPSRGVLPWEPAPKEEQQKARRLYRAAVSWTDYNVKRLLDELDSLGLSDSTAIVFHGDHGWHLGEHGLWCKQSNFELVARVPLIVHVPWLPQSSGQRSNALVELVDLMPTTLDLMSIADRVPDFDELEGTSFLPLLKSSVSDAAWKNATFTQYPRCNGTDGTGKAGGGALLPWDYPTNNPCTGVGSSNFEAMGLSIRTLSWRYTRWLRWNGNSLTPRWHEPPVGEELYDHVNDEGDETDKFENVNLASLPEHDKTKQELFEQLKMGWQKAKPPHAGMSAFNAYYV